VYNTEQSGFLTAFLYPLSIYKISYFHEVNKDLGERIYFDSNLEVQRFNLLKVDEIKDFLNTLDINNNYIGALELSKHFLFNKISSSTTITKFY
jgi:hypothetical protein